MRHLTPRRSAIDSLSSAHLDPLTERRDPVVEFPIWLLNILHMNGVRSGHPQS